MVGSQHDEHAALQHFFQWHLKEQRQGRISSALQSDRPFLPDTSIEAYFNDRRRIQRLLDAVFPEGDPAAYPDTKTIQESHSKVFCILLCIRQGRFINHFIQYNLDDSQLPLTSKPEHFPVSATPFWKDFAHQQWEFCAPTFKYNMDRRFDAIEYVLPILDIEELRAGGSGASTYKIVLHESHDRLHPNPHKHSSSPDPRAHTYVLKTYRTKDAEKYYQKEVGGFKRLRYGGRGGNPCPQIIGFYGSFVHNDNYNILLEYADGGTLEDYFKSTDPPSSGQDIVTFWTRLLSGVFEALKLIHMAGHNDSQDTPIFHGWHQDLKPANILVKACADEQDDLQSGIQRLYECEFKVADLGLSHFRKTVPYVEATDRDARGTRTYGAPECWRDPITEESGLDVKQNVDVWSLGCVLSEAACWVVKGYHYVLEYRQRRARETSGIDDFDEGDCFHNGIEVLDTVSEAHAALSEDVRSKDHITKAVLRLIEEDMLVEADARSNAKQLHLKAKKIIKKARTEIGLEAPDDLAMAPKSESADLRVLSRNNSAIKQEPYDHSSLGRSSKSFRHRRQESDVLTPNIDEFQRRESKAAYHSRSDGSTSTMDDFVESPKENWLNDEEKEFSKVTARTSVDNHHQRQQPSNSARWPSSNQYRPEISVASGKRPMHSPSHSFDAQESLESVAESNAETIVSPAQPLSSAGGLRQTTFPTAPPPGTPARRPGPSSELPLLDPAPHLLGLQTNQANKASISRGRQPHVLSVDRAMQWKQEKKANKSTSLPNYTLLNELHQRDCAFLIDDAATMKPYRSHILKCLGLLGYIVKNTDDDGFEVYFTMSQKHGKSKKFKDSTKLVAEAERRPFVGESNMREALSPILHEYKKKLEKSTSSGTFRSTKEAKRLIIYILTDGVWQERCDLKPIIKEMVSTLEKLGLHNAQLGIQFIQFGKDEEGTRKLESLDSGMKLEGAKDIVDNEPFLDGNVWKMLLGSINKWFDQDPIGDSEIADATRSTSLNTPYQDSSTRHA